MIVAETMAPTLLDAVAAQIGPRAAGMVAAGELPGGGTFELGETLRIHVAPKGAGPAEPTDTYHHQVYVDGSAAAFALSSVDGADVEVFAVGVSPLVEAIADGLTDLERRFDADASADYEVRLLVLPARQLRLLWLVDRAGGDDAVWPLQAIGAWPAQRLERASRVLPGLRPGTP